MSSGDTLLIDGSGEIPNFTQGNAPWGGAGSTITTVIINEGITGIGDYAFSGLSALENISLPSTLETASDTAFGSRELFDIFKESSSAETDVSEYSIKILKPITGCIL